MILYIEDDPEYMCLIGDFFSHRGYHFMMAFNIEEAKEAVRGRTPIDIIFLDLKFQVSSGREFLGYLKTKQITTPVFVLTAHPQELIDLEPYSSQISGVFVKPIILQELLSQTRQILDRV